VTTSEPVRVSGTPTYAINVGGVNKTATYDLGSSTSTSLAFYYTVQVGDTDTSGGVTAASNALTSSGSIEDVAGNSLGLSTPAIASGTNSVLVNGVSILPNMLFYGGLGTATSGLSVGAAATWLQSTVMSNTWISYTIENNLTKINMIQLRDSTTTPGLVEYYRIAASTSGNVSASALQALNFGNTFGALTPPSGSGWTLAGAGSYQYSTINVDVLNDAMLLTNDTGISTSDNISNNGLITVVLKSNEPNIGWQYSRDGGVTWTLGGTLTYAGVGIRVATFTLPEGNYASNLVQVAMLDALGNAGVPLKNSIPIVVDVTAPSRPTLTADATVAGTISRSEATLASGVLIVTAENGAYLTVTATNFSLGGGVLSKNYIMNGTSQTIIITDDDLSRLGDGVVNVVAKVTDAAGNSSSSQVLTVNIDATAPAAPILTFANSVTLPVSGAAAVLATGLLSISGEAGGILNLLFSGPNGMVTQTLNTTGSLQNVSLTSTNLSTLGDGNINVTATVTDAAGNVGAVSNLSFVLDTIAPSAPTITLGNGVSGIANLAVVTQPSGVVSVTAEARSSVTVLFTSASGSVTKTLIGAGSANPQPVTLTSADIATLSNNNSVTGAFGVNVRVVAPDLANNNSSPSSTTFQMDAVAPTPTVAAQTILVTDSVSVQSSEAGTAYLVKSTRPVSSASDILNAPDNEWNQVSIASANAPILLAATGLITGTYKLYVVDYASNISVAATNQIKVVTAPNTSVTSVTAAGVDTTGALNVGDKIKIAVNMYEAVTVDSTLGNPLYNFTWGSTPKIAQYSAADSTSTRLVFYYTILQGDTAIDNATVTLRGTASGLALNGGVIKEVAAPNDIAITSASEMAFNTSTPFIVSASGADTTAPTVLNVLSNINGRAIAVADNPLRLTYVFSEAVTGLTTSDFTVTNGTVSSIAGSGLTYTVNITPTQGIASGNLTVTLAANSYQDLATTPNSNTVVTTKSLPIDTLIPVTPSLTIG
ncbi:MAG: Ig-like domain-containing protein, partial [Methylophilaceae bacterium]|nr:Ig-like domain-containing protein [Methylophilaceae bacterium]